MWNEGIDLRYNIYQGNFEAKLESGIIVIDPIKNNIDTLKYREEVFVKKYLEVGKDKILVVYLSLLGQQIGYAIYKQYRIKFTEAITDTDLYHKAKPAGGNAIFLQFFHSVITTHRSPTSSIN